MDYWYFIRCSFYCIAVLSGSSYIFICIVFCISCTANPYSGPSDLDWWKIYEIFSHGQWFTSSTPLPTTWPTSQKKTRLLVRRNKTDPTPSLHTFGDVSLRTDWVESRIGDAIRKLEPCTSHLPSVGFGANIPLEWVDKHPSTNTYRPESSGMDTRTNEGWWGREEPWCRPPTPAFLQKIAYALCSCSNVANSVLSLNPCWSLVGHPLVLSYLFFLIDRWNYNLCSLTILWDCPITKN